MRDFKYVKFNVSVDEKMTTNSLAVYPLFGFAAQEYLARYGKKIDDINAKKTIFGVIVDPTDTLESIQAMIQALHIRGEYDTLLYVFDMTHVDDDGKYGKRADSIRAMFEDETGCYGETFEELRGVYENRIVFARKPNPITEEQWT